MELRNTLSEYRSEDDVNVFMAEVINENDPRSSFPQMTEAKRQEIRGLLERGAFKVILREEIPPDANVLPGRFVLAIKSADNGQAKWKARYVIGGHRDKLKRLMVHSAKTLQPASIRLLLGLAAVHKLKVWTSDVRQLIYKLLNHFYVRYTLKIQHRSLN